MKKNNKEIEKAIWEERHNVNLVRGVLLMPVGLAALDASYITPFLGIAGIFIMAFSALDIFSNIITPPYHKEISK